MSGISAPTKEDELLAERAIDRSHLREVDFRRARAHSSTVRALKWSLPAIGLVLAVAFGVYTFLSRVPQFSYDIASVAYADGKLVMSNPKLNGVTNDDRPYSMTASRALQDPAKQSVIELEGIDATVPIDATNSAAIKADRGIYNSNKNTLDIGTPIVVESTNGMTARLKSASVNIEKGTLKSSEPVEITHNGNTVTADRFSILDNGKVMVFSKRVRLNIVPSAQPNSNSGDQNAGN